MSRELWLTSADPGPMLESLRGEANARGLRRFLAYCCRRVRHLIPEAEQAVAVAEQWADTPSEAGGHTDAFERVLLAARAVRRRFLRPTRGTTLNRPLPALLVLAVALRPKDGSRGPLWNGVTGTSVLGGEEDADLARQARGASTYTADAVAENAARREGAHRGLVARLLSPTAPGTQVVGEQTRANELGRHAALLRCLLGNPFGPVHVDPAWLRWNDGTVQKLAGVFGPDRRIELLPILADALEDAGCTEPYLLTHCREPIVHGRDCWVFKLLPGELAPG